MQDQHNWVLGNLRKDAFADRMAGKTPKGLEGMARPASLAITSSSQAFHDPTLGLSLAICQRLARALGRLTRLSSRPGEPVTLFRFPATD